MRQRMLFGCLCVLTLTCAAAAVPPGLQPNPRGEARELDPVARDFHLTDLPAVEEAEVAPRATGPAGGVWELLLAAHEMIEGFTMPLGAAPVSAEM